MASCTDEKVEIHGRIYNLITFIWTTYTQMICYLWINRYIIWWDWDVVYWWCIMNWWSFDFITNDEFKGPIHDKFYCHMQHCYFVQSYWSCMGDIDAKMCYNTIDVNNIVSIKLIMYGVLFISLSDHQYSHDGHQWPNQCIINALTK